jgi:hypothetical protein
VTALTLCHAKDLHFVHCGCLTAALGSSAVLVRSVSKIEGFCTSAVEYPSSVCAHPDYGVSHRHSPRGILADRHADSHMLAAASQREQSLGETTA